ncbi:MAG: hypothetical protein HRU11_03430 [Parvularculaceae bacterium]|nr:hypothetical protein [Parvularculaceae bacterium]
MIVLALFAYIFVQMGIAAWAARGTINEGDYLVAGRTLGTWSVALSVFASWFAAETVIATSAEVAANGMAGARVEPFGYGLGIIALALIFAVRLRKAGHMTIAGFLGSRFGSRVQVSASIVVALSATVWASAQLNALAVIITESSGLPFLLSLMIGTGLVIGYTWIGGMKGDVATDVIQGMVMMVGLAIILWLLIEAAGGLKPALDSVPEARWSLRGEEESWLDRMELWLIPIFGTVVAQEAISRVLAAKSPNIAKNGALLGAVIYLLVGLIPVALGLLGTGLNLEVTEGDGYFTSLARALLPAWLFVIVSGALLSAILSSVDSALLSASAVTTETVLERRGDGMSAEQRLLLARGLTAAAGIIAAVIAASGESLRDLVLTAGSISSLLLVPMLAAVFTSHHRAEPVLASVGLSLIASGILDWWLGVPGALLYAIAVGALAWFIGAIATRSSA